MAERENRNFVFFLWELSQFLCYRQKNFFNPSLFKKTLFCLKGLQNGYIRIKLDITFLGSSHIFVYTCNKVIFACLNKNILVYDYNNITTIPRRDITVSRYTKGSHRQFYYTSSLKLSVVCICASLLDQNELSGMGSNSTGLYIVYLNYWLL